MFRNYFKKPYKYFVYIGLFFHTTLSFAGSYEDFFIAIKNDEVKVISSLFVRGFDPNTVDLNGEPAILNTLRHGSLKSFEFIAKQPKVNLNVRNSHGESALMLLCLKGDLELAKMLIKRDASPASLYAGQDIFQTVPAYPQIETNLVSLNQGSQFQVQVLNTSTQAQSFTLVAKPSGNGGWMRSYFLGTQSMTSQLEAPGGANLP
ncbi:MAG: hypothetical protein RLZZ152_991, partial [Pseudomonadota bacterium]